MRIIKNTIAFLLIFYIFTINFTGYVQAEGQDFKTFKTQFENISGQSTDSLIYIILKLIQL